MKTRYFDFKDDVTIEDIADILQVAWGGGIINSAFKRLKPSTKRHFITKNRSSCCDLCGGVLLVDDTCTNKDCDNYY